MIRKPTRNNPRDTEAYRLFRETVLKRDGRKCQMPGCGSRKRLQVHHITRWADSAHGRLNPSNAITLCFNCHKNKVTRNELMYAALFIRIIGDNIAKQKRKD